MKNKMVKIKELFNALSLKFAKNVEWCYVKECLAEYDNTQERNEWAAKFWELPMCKQTLLVQDKQLKLLRELGKTIRMLRMLNEEGNQFYVDSNDDWSKIAEFVSIKEFQAYIYAMCHMATLPKNVIDAAPEILNDNINLTLAINASSTYLLTLTIPGANEGGLYDSDMIKCCTNIFQLLQERPDDIIRNNLIWMFALSYCDDLKLVFCYAKFAEHKQSRNVIVKCLVQVLYDNYTHDASDIKRNILSNQFHSKCFEILEQVINGNHGDIAETLNFIMEMTFHMHSFNESPDATHISQWFMGLIDKHPDIIKKMLSTFIETALKTPLPSWEPKDENVSLCYAAKYENFLYSKYKISCVDLLKITVRDCDAIDVQIRSIYLMEQILQLDKYIEGSTLLREVTMIGELLYSLNDRSSAVRCRAAEALSRCTKNGPETASRILTECFSFTQFNDPNQECSRQYSERPDVLQYAYSFEGYDDIESVVLATPDVIYKRLLNSSNNFDRLLGLILIEHIILINERIIYDTNFASEISCLVLDPITVNRRALLSSLGRLLQIYWKCPIVIDIYSLVVCSLMNDKGDDLQKHAFKSFYNNVLLKIQKVEAMTEPEHKVPWRILDTMIHLQPREQTQRRLALSLRRCDVVTVELVDTIIAYLTQPMAAEAWTLLIFLSSRITNNLDSIITTLDDLTSNDPNNIKLLAFELMISCLKNFSNAALKQLFKHLLLALKTGDMRLPLVGPALRLLNGIDELARATVKWRVQLYKAVSSSILKLIENNKLEDSRLESLLGVYTELLANSPNQKANGQVVRYVCNYVESKAKLKKFTAYDTEEERILNWMIVISGRLALHDDTLAFKMSKNYEALLSKNERPQLINSTLIALLELSQKHPNIFENNIKAIMIKLSSSYPITRLATYRCVKDVILGGKFKANGIILIALLAGLVDDCDQLARQADGFFVCYQEIFDKDIFQHCLKECPFDFNDLPLVKSSRRCYEGFTSPLKGTEKSKIRRLIYNYIIASMNDSSLLCYLGQLKYLSIKTKDVKFLKSPGALDVILDMIFIMSRICVRTQNKQVKTTDPMMFLQRCLPCIPQISRQLSGFMTPELQDNFNQFCKAVTVRFSHFSEVSEPIVFWKKFQNMGEDDAFKSEYGDIASFGEMPSRQFPSSMTMNAVNEQAMDIKQLATELTVRLYNW